MPHAMMTACGLSLLHRYKYKKVLGKLKGGSAQRKGAGMKKFTTMPVEPKFKSAVMPMDSVRPKRVLAMKS